MAGYTLGYDVHLDALNLDVSVPWNISLYDHGPVEDLEAYKDSLIFSYNGKFMSDILDSAPHGAVGSFIALNKIFAEGNAFCRVDCHIAYLEGSPNQIETHGHEETHFLSTFDQLPVLSKGILSRQGIKIDFRKLRKDIFIGEDCNEVISEIGGIFAQSQREGWEGVFNFYKSDLPRTNYFDWALAVYCEANEKSMKKSGRQNHYLEMIAETL